MKISFNFNKLEPKMAHVSVVIPCYRCKKTINRALMSVVTQSLLPYEVILVDDASCDETLIILQELEKIYKGWIRVIALEKNIGAAGARNMGWAAANQPYIAFLDADDTWPSEKIYIQYRYMRDHPNIAISGNKHFFLREGDLLPKISFEHVAVNVFPKSLIFKNCFGTSTVMLNRNILFRFIENKRYAEDLYLWQQIAFSGLLVSRIDVPLAYAHKSLYGASGLSAQLWEMEKGELDNIKLLYKNSNINWFMLMLASGFSILKFFKRLIFVTSGNLLNSKVPAHP